MQVAQVLCAGRATCTDDKRDDAPDMALCLA